MKTVLTEKTVICRLKNSKSGLIRLFPKSELSLILVNIDDKKIDSYCKEVLDLMYPLESEMDINISCVLKLAAIGEGVDFETGNKIKAEGKVMFSGLGADEYFAGYSRHRVAYIRGGYKEMNEEMLFDQNRLWLRNLGRDDRIIASERKEMRTPFLNKELIAFSKEINLRFLSFYKGVGKDKIWENKKTLRRLGNELGMKVSSGFKKKAIQFGTGLAKEANNKKYGSNRKGKGQLKAKDV